MTPLLIMSLGKVKPTFEDIKNLVCEHLNINQEKLFTKNRSRELVEARQFIMLICKRETNLTLKNIGACMGGLDHTTIIHGYKTMQDLIETDLLIRDKWLHFTRILQQRYRNKFA